MRFLALACLAASLSALVGCETPIGVRTEDELVRTVGQKVTVSGRYELGRAGETLDAGTFRLALDREGGGLPPVGSEVRATGVVQRGAMSLGVFINEVSLRAMRNQPNASNVPETVYVLRHAKLDLIDAAPPPKTRPVPPAGAAQ